VPTTLQQGELAVNITDKKMWVGNAATTPVQLLGAGVTGDVVGPASATDNAISRFDGTTGKIIQNSVVTIADSTGNMTGVGTLSSGAITTTGVLTVPAGTVSDPAITTTGDTNTGIFFPAADTIAFTEGGAEAMRIDSSGRLGIGTTSPSTALQVNGTATATTFSGAGTSLTGTANSLNAGIGVNQTWQDVGGSRAIGTTYTNSTGKPIMVVFTATCTAGNTVQGLTIDGVAVYAGSVNVNNLATGVTLIVPNGATYVTLTNGGILTLVSWHELR
jgi:hypothetical protein